MRHGIGERLKSGGSEQVIFRACATNDGVPAHERKGSHAKRKHEHRQMESETQFLPSERFVVNVGGLGR